jgi:hypothetical protein
MDTLFNAYFMRHDQDDLLSFVYQMPHGWDPSSSVRPHLHIIPMADPASNENVYFNGRYIWTAARSTPITTSLGWTPFTATFTVSGTGQSWLTQSVVSLFEATAPLGARVESAILMMYVRREGGSVNDTYTTSKPGAGTAQANLLIASADCHVRKVKPGTIVEYPGA